MNHSVWDCRLLFLIDKGWYTTMKCYLMHLMNLTKSYCIEDGAVPSDCLLCHSKKIKAFLMVLIVQFRARSAQRTLSRSLC